MFVRHLNILLVFIFTLKLVLSVEECKNVSDEYRFHLGTKTPYRFVGNTFAQKMDFPGCEPRKLWMLVRHGTRTPSASLIENMKEKLPGIRNTILKNNIKPNDHLRNSDLFAFKKWKLRIDDTKEKVLAHEGEDEMIDLAERLQIRFPSLLPPVYSNTSFYFKFTKSQRTKASARYFAAGLFGRQNVKDVWYPKPSKQDLVLRFYKLCNKWTNEVKNSKDAIAEKSFFETSYDMHKGVESVNDKLHLRNTDRLSLGLSEMFVRHLNILLVFIFTLKLVLSVEECKNVSDEYRFHLGTKTPYRFVGNTFAQKMDFPGCEPRKLWMLVRHGTRTPSASLIENMKEKLPGIRNTILKNNIKPNDHLRNSDLFAFKKWKLRIDDTKEKVLAHEGEDEMIDLAERLQIRFPSLLPPVYSNTSFYFKFTKSQRTKASARYFAAGLFGRQNVKDVWYPKPSKQDLVLRFYKLCNKWTNEVKNSKDAIAEKSFFETSYDMHKGVESVNDKLHLRNTDRLSLENVHLMYMTCAFETAWDRKNKSPWCSALPPEAFQALEYMEDLKYYYKDGYGHEITYKPACVTFKDMLNHFESIYEYPKSTVYFTHSGTLLKMLTHMGLYNDSKPLTYKDFDKSNRDWRVSKIDAFGTNLAFVLYRCGEDYKVLTLHQEHVVQLPNCENELCNLEQIKMSYSDSIQNCKFNLMCDNKT